MYVRANDWRQSRLIFFIAGNLVNVFNYGFHVLTGLWLSSQDYGVMSALLSVFFIFSIISLSLQALTAKQWIKFRGDRPKHYVLVMVKKVLFITLAIVGLAFVINPLLQSFLHYESALLLWLICFSLLAGFLLAVMRGVMQAEKLLGVLGLNMVFESALKVLILTFVFMTWELSVAGAFASMVIAIWIAILWAPWKDWIKRFKLKEVSNQPTLNFWHELLKISLGVGAITLFFNLDMILVQHLVPHLAGDYSVASKFGQLIFFALFLLANIFFADWIDPKNSNKKRNQRQHIYGILLGVTGLTFVVFSYYFLGDFLVQISFGTDFIYAGKALWASGLFFLALGLNNTILYWAIARGYYYFLYPLFLMLLVFCVGIWIWHQTLQQIFLWGLGVQILILIFMYASYQWVNFKSRPTTC